MGILQQKAKIRGLGMDLIFPCSCERGIFEGWVEKNFFSRFVLFFSGATCFLLVY